MIPEEELGKAIELAKKYCVGRLYVVGSSLRDPEAARDYNFAVSDVPEGAFFPFYGELFMSLQQACPIHLLGIRTF